LTTLILSPRPWPLGAAHVGRSHLHLVALADHQNLVELDLGACLGGELLHPEGIPLPDAILLATGLDYRIHSGISSQKLDETAGLGPVQPNREL
jgi:hypothetical protein